jgi:two-component system response regulator FixJ
VKDKLMMDRIILHILDSNSARRAQLAHMAFAAGHHAEIYASISELITHAPSGGIVLSQDDQQHEQTASLIAEMKRAGQWLPVIAIAEHPTTTAVVRAIKAGALEYISTPLKIEDLNQVVSQVSDEAETQRGYRARAANARLRINCLSSREREVLDHLSEGCSNKAIARSLEISPRTVEIHRMKMMGKLGANHAADAVRLKLEATGMEAA